jgi:hypothetical protein
MAQAVRFPPPVREGTATVWHFKHVLLWLQGIFEASTRRSPATTCFTPRRTGNTISSPSQRAMTLQQRHGERARVLVTWRSTSRFNEAVAECRGELRQPSWGSDSSDRFNEAAAFHRGHRSPLGTELEQGLSGALARFTLRLHGADSPETACSGSTILTS